MAAEEHENKGYGMIDPDEFYDFEERYVEKGGGGGKSADSGKGKKTFKAMKSQAIRAAHGGRKQALAEKLGKSISNQLKKNDEKVLSYLSWVNQNLSGDYVLDPEEIEISFARSGGPGGQNVNKRETKVIALHGPTGVQTSADQTRSQLENRHLALGELESRLGEHLDDWRAYLESGRMVDKELVKELLEKEL